MFILPKPITLLFSFVFFFKQKTAYEISSRDWSSDGALPICSRVGSASSVSRSPSAFPSLCSEREIGRASCRERVCELVYISVVAVSLKKKKRRSDEGRYRFCRIDSRRVIRADG